MPFWVRVRGLHRFLVLALQSIPLLFRCFALHLRQSLWHMPSWMQGLLSRFLREVLFDPSPESLLQRLWLWVMEPRGDFVPSVPLTQHLENLANLLAMVHLDPSFDQFDQQLPFIDLVVACRVCEAVSIEVPLQRAQCQGNRVLDVPLGLARGEVSRFPDGARPHAA